MISYSSDMDDLAMTFSDFVNALKMLICSEKTPYFFSYNYGYPKKVVIDRWPTIKDFITRIIFCKF